MAELAIIIIKFTNPEKSDEFINTNLTYKELLDAIHFFEERKRKNVKGGRPKIVEKWVQRFLEIKHYFLFEELDLAYQNKELGRDSYYRIQRQLKEYGWNRKFLTKLYQFTQLIRKLVHIISNFREYQKARETFIKAHKTFKR